MALREDQIQRYSRQILLKEVGGRGQASLLSAPVRVDGHTRALDVAIAYLAVSGTRIVTAPAPRFGFHFGVELSAVSPDAVGDAGAVRGWLGQWDDARAIDRALFRVAITNGSVTSVPPGLAFPEELEPHDEAPPVSLGAFAALLVQRCALGFDRSVRSVVHSGARWVTA